MPILLFSFALLFGCSVKQNYSPPSLMSAQLQVLNIDSVMVSELGDPTWIKAAVHAPKGEFERVLVEWWSLEDGMLAVHQPDSNGLVQINTSMLSQGLHTLYVTLREDGHIIQQRNLTILIQEPLRLKDDFVFINEDVKLHPLLRSNQLNGCDVSETAENIWFCPNYTATN